jgi:Holliday junction DNA helicase RuvA
MIALLSGTLAASLDGAVIVDCGGVGYQVSVSAQTAALLPPSGQEVVIHTHMVVRDDSMSLFGFATVAERELFLALTTVPSVGPKLAMAVVGSAPVDVLSAAIGSGDAARLQSVPGVGKRTAERICLDLKESLVGFVASTDVAGMNSSRSDARDALLGLGMNEREVESLLDEASGETAEELISSALRLSKAR